MMAAQKFNELTQKKKVFLKSHCCASEDHCDKLINSVYFFYWTFGYNLLP
jgi:hypothetical protein